MNTFIKPLLLIFLALLPGIAEADSDTPFLDKAVDKIKNSPSLTADFTVSSGGNTANGTITMSKSRFALVSPQGSIWYDGKTLWNHLHSSNEVNISEPTPDELQEINPFAFLNSVKANFNCRTLKSNQPGTTVIEMKAKKNGSSISKAVVTFNTSTLLPSKINLTIDGRNAVVNVKSIKTGKTIPSSSFRFNPDLFPTAEIIDLR